jgi:tetratricopeptide (TPR) repeat protein
MSHKKTGTLRKKAVKKRASKKTSRAKPTPLPIPMDRRVMERAMSDIHRLLNEQQFESIEEANAFLQTITNVRDIPAPRNLSPLEQAQDKMYEAWEASGKRREKLAREALEICPDCADAYVLLAEETARTPQEAKQLYEEGVKAGERALGPEAFEEDAGHFWGLMETRPYMRARAGLAECLWALGDRPQAIAHYTDMLRLNPGDNQGLRYELANCLLGEGNDEALGKLLKQYDDDASAVWRYTRALWLFRTEGASRAAHKALIEALYGNPFVPAYLLAIKKMPRQRPAYIGFGDENEAVVYVGDHAGHWLETPKALEWFAESFIEEVEKKGGPPGKGKSAHK